MIWSIANAKQQFSEVVRLTAEEPQAIYNRDKPVAVMVSPEAFQEFQRLQALNQRPSLVEQFDKLRAALAADGFADGIEIAPRSNRYNPMVDDPNYWDE